MVGVLNRLRGMKSVHSTADTVELCESSLLIVIYIYEVDALS